MGIRVKRKGTRACGCYLKPGDRAAIVGRQQWCVGCALAQQGLTWELAEANPDLMRRLKLTARG